MNSQFNNPYAAYRYFKDNGTIKNPHLTIVHYDRPSSQNRMIVRDMSVDEPQGRVIGEYLVAHGRQSGLIIPTKFSNVIGSNMSSLGAILARNTYIGKHGLSLRLEGLEPGLNDNIEARAIVVHAADYVSESFINKTGRLGRSEGCLAVDFKYRNEIINNIKGDSLIYAVGD